jgi:hypothetical protein
MTVSVGLSEVHSIEFLNNSEWCFAKEAVVV